jgi:hypothetical protein
VFAPTPSQDGDVEAQCRDEADLLDVGRSDQDRPPPVVAATVSDHRVR